MDIPKVYFTKDITTDNLFRLYDALGVNLKGKIGVKASTGEAGPRDCILIDLDK